MKLTQAKLKQLAQDHVEYNRFLKQRHMPKITLDEYINQVFGRAPRAAVKKRTEVYKPQVAVKYMDRQHYPSVMGTGLAVCAKTQPQTYSGEQKLLGIATLHKSNMVPVFARQDAEDIAKMRRN
jgi:hypothetical protein